MWTFLKRLFQSKQEKLKIDPMKYLVVGLGNVGAKYDNTRHNIGFEVVDYLSREKDVPFSLESQAHMATIKHKGRTLVLLKPTTYMNLSGKAVRYWMTKEKIPIERVLIVVDDLNLDFGSIRLRGKGSAGGHNGLKHIEQVLQTGKYARLKMGIGDQFSKGKQVNYVLGEWSNDEKSNLPTFIEEAAKVCLDFTTLGLARTMSNHNKSTKKTKPNETQ